MKRVPWALAVASLGVACRAGAPPALGDEPDIASTRLSCDDLAGLTAYDYSINSATLVPASEELPEYCEVKGQILPEVAFELRLPTRWNRRFLMFGNGGLAGVIHVWDLDDGVKQYFAVASTNTGHRAPPSFEHAARFATDRQKLIDYAYRAVHVTVLTAKQIIGSYYDAPLAFSYFSGCSTGGRQGLMSAQRFPDDFDGILVGAPVLDVVGQVVSDAWIQKALRNAPVDLHLLADRVYAACDSVDGLTDGVIDDPRRCSFDPSKDLPLCSASSAGSGCYPDEQVRALAGFYEDVVAGEERLAPGYPVGSEVFVKWAPQREASGWLGWRRGVDRPFFVAITETVLRYLAFEQPDPEFDVFAFDFDEDPERMDWLRPLLNATSPDVSRFRDRGGKLLMYFGWADQGINPLRGIEYYGSVMDEMGAAVPDFFRLFMVPGMFHCTGGVGVDSVAWLPTLVEWVEGTVAPERIVGTRTGVTPRVGADAIGRTRPLCPYPQVARYAGEGSIDDAANFVCADPGVP